MSIKVAYLGRDESTFGYRAMVQYFKNIGVEIKPEGCVSHISICEKVGKKHVDLGIVAIENVLDGVVPETARAIENEEGHLGLKIQGEVILPIELYFASKTGNIKDVKKVISHPSAIGQCDFFIDSLRADGVVIETRSSTGGSAEEASLNKDLSTLSAMDAISKHKLKLIKRKSVVNHSNSATRFWVLGKEHAKRTGNDKTCFLVNLEQSQAGALHKTLGVFASEDVNLLIIYPISIFGKCWEYTFLIEVEGHIDDKPIERACVNFKKLGIALRGMQFLGSYPNSTI